MPLTIFNRATAVAATLSDGTVMGESKKFVNINAGTATVTPTTFAQGTSFSITENGACEAIWVTGSGWHMIGSADSSDAYITIT